MSTGRFRVIKRDGQWRILTPNGFWVDSEETLPGAHTEATKRAITYALDMPGGLDCFALMRLLSRRWLDEQTADWFCEHDYQWAETAGEDSRVLEWVLRCTHCGQCEQPAPTDAYLARLPEDYRSQVTGAMQCMYCGQPSGVRNCCPYRRRPAMEYA